MINTLNLVENIDGSNPTGLNNIDLSQLSNITNNFVQHIDCTCLDEYEFNKRKEAIATIYQKLSIGGSTTLKFINLDLLGNQIEKLELTGIKFSEMLPKIKSVWSEFEAMEVLGQLSLDITEMHYTYIYTIIKLEKTQ